MEFTFIRHGNAVKSKNDLERKLTPLGEKQATDRKTTIGKEFDVVISSPAIRACQTASLVAGIDINDVVLCNELYLPANKSDEEEITKLFEELGYSSLRKYLKRNSELFSRYGRYAQDAIRNRVTNNHIKDVLIVGHAILLNAAAEWFSNDPFIVDCCLGECEGLYIPEDGNVVRIR